MTRRNILFNLPTGSHYRNMLQSRVLDELLTMGDYRFVFVTDAWDLPEFQAEFERFEPDRIAYHPAKLFRDNVREKLYRFMANRFPLTKYLHGPARAWHALARNLFDARDYRPLFDKYPPALVVLPSPGIIYHDLPMFRAASSEGIRTLSVVNSWDNLVTKWPRFAACDRIAVWNPMMVDDAIRRHHYHRDECRVVGISHYDWYQQPETYFGREEFFQRLELDPNRKLICLTTAPSVSLSDHTFILEELLTAQKAGAFGDAQILCRFHPAEDGREYDRFKGRPGVTFDHPGRKVREPFGFFPTFDDVRRLASTLKYSDVVINMASTTTIESGIVGTPVINLGFSISQPEAFEYHIVKNHWGKHYKHILECNAVLLARSKEQLVEHIQVALKDKSLNRDAAWKMAEKMSYSLDGKNSRRVAEAIREGLG